MQRSKKFHFRNGSENNSFLNLNELEKNLLLLANYSQTKSTEVKSPLFDKILENLEIEEQKIIAIQYKDYVTSNTMSLVRMILA